MKNLKPKGGRRITLVSGLSGVALVMLGEYLYASGVMRILGIVVVFIAVTRSSTLTLKGMT